MTTHQQQQGSDFLHWMFYHSPYNGDMIQHDAGDIHYQTYYFRGHTDTQSSQIENDEVIARTLQEEFSHLAMEEASEFSYAGEQQLQASSEPHHWHSSSTSDYYRSGYEYGQDESNDSVPPSSCSSPSDSELTNGYLLDDDEVGKRLNPMIPIPHIPRINGEIPSIDEAMSDHERLLNRLQLYGFVELKVEGDGNCQFRALSDQLYHTPDNHKDVRQQIVAQLKSHPQTYEGYVPMDYADYLKKMSKSGEWGDHVTLQAAADLYSVRISVITSFKDTCYIEILPNFKKSKRVIFLSFWAEVHYNSIYFQGDPSSPSAEVRRKKKWWIFGK